jgi:hypothetical protein
MRAAKALCALVCLGGASGVSAEPALFSAVPVLQMQPTWAWVIGAAAVALIVGFLLGWRMLDRRIRKKYGGLRIY